MTPAEAIIEKFGGLTQTAKAAKKPLSTVQGWKERGTIPQNHWSVLINASSVLDAPLTISDFVEVA